MIFLLIASSSLLLGRVFDFFWGLSKLVDLVLTMIWLPGQNLEI